LAKENERIMAENSQLHLEIIRYKEELQASS
jgi:hypothetical protein